MEPQDSYGIYKTSPLVPIMSQMNPVHIDTLYFLKIILMLSPHIYISVFEVASSNFPIKVWYALLNVPMRATYTADLSSMIWSYNIWRKAQILKLFIVQCFPLSCQIPSRKFQVFPSASCPQFVLFPKGDRPSSTSTQNNVYNYTAIYFGSGIFHRKRKIKYRNWKTTNTPRVESALISLTIQFWVVSVVRT
jgi:hypothetical protein